MHTTAIIVFDVQFQVESALGLLRVLGPHLNQGSPSVVSASLAAHQKQVMLSLLDPKSTRMNSCIFSRAIPFEYRFTHVIRFCARCNL